ncbi:MAG: peptide chain release factor 1 [Campylobacteraceae bacterium]|jgi:peptide chain release factor 1|nr:peptide chain release factor 1 [Campylobacteraceae bacterium]
MLQDKLQPFIDRYDEITRLLSEQDIATDIKRMTELSKEQSSLSEIVEASREYQKLMRDIEDNKALLDDAELGELAKMELKELEERRPQLEDKIKLLLVPKDPNDDRNTYLEIRAGTGGDEAGLFAGDLCKAYIRYAESKGWKVEIVSSAESDVGGYKDITLLVKGDKVYSKLKYEGGVHRVQRVPATETQGRLHTSAVTVAVIPEVDDIEIELKESELRIDVYRSGGNGGQSVNTTDSAVRVTHISTGISVAIQDEKSQHKNKDKAIKILKSRLYEIKLQEQQAATGESRKSQVGSGDRSERIRTYNYPQNRITDHRIGLTLYRLDAIMQGGLFDEIIEPCTIYFQAEKLKETEA